MEIKINIPFLGKKESAEKENLFEEEAFTIKDIISPSSVSIGPNDFKLGKRFAKSFFVFTYPRYLTTAWFAPVINLNVPLDIAFHIHPIETGPVLKDLRKKITALQSEIIEREEKGLIRDPGLDTAYQDLEDLRESLRTAQERVFKLGLYVTVYGDSQEEIKEIENTLRSMLESKLIYIKPALYRQREGFNTTAPYGLDQLSVLTSMPSGSLSSTFPFISSDLSSNEGILYGLNMHNNSLVLFDRFSLPNANSVIFASSGSGKSYAIKLEILRSLMIGVDCLVIDPDNEYKKLAEAAGGSFFNLSLSSPEHINPFDLPTPREDEDPRDVLRSNVVNLVGLLRIMFGGLTPEEDSIVDRALTETYAARDITPETDPATWQERVPLFEDFEEVLNGMEGTDTLVEKLRKYTKGTFGDFFNKATNIDTDKQLVVFGMRDMEDELRPTAMFIVLRYIWNKVRSERKKRILAVDEAWNIMKSEDGASFLFGLCKRARKYWLGVTTITQDVNDFMKSTYGQPIITNSSMQMLLKQSPATMDVVQKTFNLTEEEKFALLEAEVGTGLFFAGLKHVAIKIVASYTEDQIITTDPAELEKIKQAKKLDKYKE